jgi:hypothetical protein
MQISNFSLLLAVIIIYRARNTQSTCLTSAKDLSTITTTTTPSVSCTSGNDKYFCQILAFDCPNANQILIKGNALYFSSTFFVNVYLSDVQNNPTNTNSVKEYYYQVFFLIFHTHVFDYFFFKARYNYASYPYYGVFSSFNGNSYGAQTDFIDFVPTPGENFTLSITCDSQNWKVS